MHTHPGAAGAGAVNDASLGSPRWARVPGTDLGRGERRRGGHVSAGVASPPGLPPGAARRAAVRAAAAVSGVRGGDARRVWLRDSGGGPSSPRRAGGDARGPSTVEGLLRSLDFLQ